MKVIKFKKLKEKIDYETKYIYNLGTDMLKMAYWIWGKNKNVVSISLFAISKEQHIIGEYECCSLLI